LRTRLFAHHVWKVTDLEMKQMMSDDIRQQELYKLWELWEQPETRQKWDADVVLGS